MAFKIIKRLLTVQTAIQRLAGGGTKLADHFGVLRAALRAFHHGAVLEKGIFVDAAIDGWGDTVIFEPLPSPFGDPVGSPGRKEDCCDLYLIEALFLQGGPDVDLNGIHGRTAGVGRRNDDL